MEQLNEKIKALFHSNHIEVKRLLPGYDNTNFVFDVVSDEGCCIVKVAKCIDNPNNTFWQGLSLLFNLSHGISIRHQQTTANYINQHGTIEVPRVLKADATSNNVLEAPFVILEKIAGEPIPQASDLEQRVMQEDENFAIQLGQHMGSLHLKRMNYFGTFNEQKYDLNLWPQKLQKAISILGKSRKALQDPGVQKMLPYYLAEAAKLKAPQVSSLIMLDCWPSQFLVSKNHDQFSACIDIESYAVGPVALELTLLELWLGSLGKFKEGYFTVNALWPEEIEEAREVYRFFLFLLYDCPEQGLDACIYSNAKFPQADRVRARLISPRLRPPGYPGLK